MNTVQPCDRNIHCNYSFCQLILSCKKCICNYAQQNTAPKLLDMYFEGAVPFRHFLSTATAVIDKPENYFYLIEALML